MDDNTGFMRDRECLLYVHERLRVILGEHESCEYMQKLRGIIHETQEDADSQLFTKGINDLMDTGG